METNKRIWTIGHSTRTFEGFVALLQSFEISLLVDVRTYPGSRRYPHFNKEHLCTSLPQQNIEYLHMIDLGGRRKPLPDSVNSAWRHPSFRGYADYMQTPQFKAALDQLESLAAEHRLAYMCSEATWWRCHRSLISDALKVRGWEVFHIMDTDKSTLHPYTSPARPVQGKLFYY